MPTKKDKTEFKLEYTDIDAYVKERVKIVLDTLSSWHSKTLIPAIKDSAPVYKGLDPRENFHPRGLVKMSIIAEDMPVKVIEANQKITVPKVINERAMIAIQVLHRGWNRPGHVKTRWPPYLFVLKEGEHASIPTAPNPPGPGEWIITPRIKQTRNMTKNLWIVETYKRLWLDFCNECTNVINNTKTSAPTKKIEEKK